MKNVLFAGLLAGVGSSLAFGAAPSVPSTNLFYKALDAGTYKLDLQEDGKCFMTAEVYASACSYTLEEGILDLVLENPFVNEGVDFVQLPDSEEIQEIPFVSTLGKMKFNYNAESEKFAIVEEYVKSFPENPEKESEIEMIETMDFASFDANALAPLMAEGTVALPLILGLDGDAAIVDLASDGTAKIMEGLNKLESRDLTWESSDNGLMVNFEGFSANYKVIFEGELADTVLVELMVDGEPRVISGVSASVDNSLYGAPLAVESFLGEWQWREGETLYEYQFKEGQELALSGGPGTDFQYGVWTLKEDKVIGDRFLSTESGAPLASFEEQLACSQGTLEACEIFQTRWYKIIGKDAEGNILVLRYLEQVVEGGYQGHWLHILRPPMMEEGERSFGFVPSFKAAVL